MSFWRFILTSVGLITDIVVMSVWRILVNWDVVSAQHNAPNVRPVRRLKPGMLQNGPAVAATADRSTFIADLSLPGTNSLPPSPLSHQLRPSGYSPGQRMLPTWPPPSLPVLRSFPSVLYPVVAEPSKWTVEIQVSKVSCRCRVSSLIVR
jgi:hypothetical protein